MGKKSKKSQVDDDWEAELGETIEQPAELSEIVTNKEDDDDLGGGLMSQMGKKGKKNKKKKQVDDWEEELGEVIAPVSETVAQGEEVDDLDKSLPEEDRDDEQETVKPKKGKKNQKNTSSTAASPLVEELDTALDVPEIRVKTKAEKEREKKEKEKAKKKAQAEKKKASSGKVATPIVKPVEKGSTDANDQPLESVNVSTNGKKGKKPSAAVLALQKAQAERQRLEAEAQAAAEAEQARIDAEIAAQEEEERKKEEAKQRKKDAQKAKIAEQKAAGTFMTKKQKEAAVLAEKRRQELLASGVVVAGLGNQEAKAKRPVYDNKRKKGKQQAKVDNTVEKVTEKVETVFPTEPKPKEPTPEPVKEVVEDEMESWEAALDSDGEVKDSWDAESVEDASEIKEHVKEGKQTIESESEKAKKSVDKTVQTPNARPATTQAESSDEDSGSESDSDSDSDSSSEDERAKSQSQQVAAKKRAEAAAAKEKRIAEAKAARNKDDLRSPICCIMGHVDTGKTSLLDKVRQTNVQGGEAGGITQQIGATYFPMENIMKKTKVLKAAEGFDYKLPGLLVIDTPGHESFSNLRSRGSSLCNIAILVIDIMHGLEPQTIESIKMLRDKKTPFIVALNKIDRLYAWESIPDNGFRESLAKQKKAVRQEFEKRLSDTKLALAEQGLNSELYYENRNLGKNVSLVPTSAHTGEGIPDLLQLLVTLTQQRMTDKLMYVSELECTVLEVKVIEGLGTTIDVVVVNGVLREGDRIVVAGLNGPIVTTIRAILTPQPLKELRIKGSYVHHKEVKAALGVKIAANDLEKAIAGSRMLRVEPGDDVEDLGDDVMEDLQDLFDSIDKSGVGVSVQASTLGALEALLEFLKTSKIPVSGVNIGPVYKRDIMRAGTMLEKAKEYAVMLCFDVEVDKDAQRLADEMGVTVFSADIIYHLFDSFTAHRTKALEQKRSEGAALAVFPCVLKTIAVFNKKDPIVLGVDVLEGSLRPGTPICSVKVEGGERSIIEIGKVVSMEKEHKAVDVVRKGQAGGGIAVKLEMGGQPMFGRHVTEKDLLYSYISRKSIDTLKSEAFKSDVSRDEWALIVKLKRTFGID